MIEKMQSEETVSPETPQSNKMTFTKANTLISAEKLPGIVPQPYTCKSPSKFINLEDDIEKVEIASQTSSSSLETDLLQEIAAIPQENPQETVKNWLKNIQKKTPQATRVMKYQDLPYMGEITLDNSKPRRGRKPKKADICHLIYKNYGTILPGTPNANIYNMEKSRKMPEINKIDVQNKIISSLLEKRLTQKDQNEPLNLCVRDMNHLNIQIKAETQSDDDVEIEPSKNNELRIVKNEPRATPESVSTSSPDLEAGQSPTNGSPLYWPNTFIHPIALQQQLLMYQRLAGNLNYTLPSPRPPPGSTPTPSSSNTEPASAESRKLVPKTIRAKAPGDALHQEIKTKRTVASCSDKTPAKRKRSAIFIPPIPTEATNPTTEVSICKFKFTGGAKPSLQEKKMLSVDSGGNFRYYSGTGDKSMRGYEFFPRETLQQQIGNNAQGSSTGAFLQASGEKIYPEIASKDFLLSSDLPKAIIPQESQKIIQKKRKSRKSVQREKLEKTFKEKGFLIQTQQLESAEGATYCKFRQLRKFTRYLFRSWKDYLPGNVRELSESEQRELQEVEQAAAGLEIGPDATNLTLDDDK